jgi:uncharacterized 2Fe-2S/4Fe-4S cluster protein (DUF4445 family)
MIFVRNDCGGKGVCGKCAVIVKNAGLPDRVEQRHFSADDLARGTRLACRLIIDRDLTLEVPAASLASSEIINKPALNLPASYTPTLPVNTDGRFGAAIDLGTTTIGVYLCDLERKTLVLSTAMRNPQSIYGDDVINRINSVTTEPKNLTRLQRMAVRTIEHEIQQLMIRARIKREQLDQLLVVGNSTMIHILAGVNPQTIGVFPFSPEFYRLEPFPASTIGFQLPDHVKVRTLPLLSGFLGSDIVSAGLATQITEAAEGTMLIDIGTNGEILLKGRDTIFATSCATGPAFEGASISCGMPGMKGAISRVKIWNAHSPPEVTIIPDPSGLAAKASGICGSGILSAVAELCRTGIISPDGRFSLAEETIPGLTRDQSGRVVYILVPAEECAYQRSVLISQKDIRSIQLAKSALATGITLLCRRAGIEFPSRIILAGAFGSFLSAADTVTIGMLPDIDLELIESDGNSAGAGAVLSLTDPTWQAKTKQLIDNVTIVNLASEPGFQEQFIDSLTFPSNSG